ncbi:MAG: aminoglycoside phosphotransferase family protein [bacterium]
MNPDLHAIGREFGMEGELIEGAPYGNGHINDTYLTRWNRNGRQKSWILQRINHKIFKDPPKVMENIAGVCAHIRKKLEATGIPDIDRRVLTCTPVTGGGYFFRDRDENYWRGYNFIDGATSHDVCSGPQLAYEVARTFGSFQMMLADYPAASLHETIPWFHHTPRRFTTLEKSIELDSANRCSAAKLEINFALARKSTAGAVSDLLEQGKIKPHVTHNDTKLNNVMIDNETGRGVCVIDLDTVMQGSILYDVGDLVRTSTITTAEDEQDLSKVNMDISRFEAIIRGYSETAGALPSPAEKDLLAFCGRLITFTIGIRFLADYLSGDVYFKTHRPNHNLERARVQFTMVRKMEESSTAMERIVRQYCG